MKPSDLTFKHADGDDLTLVGFSSVQQKAIQGGKHSFEETKAKGSEATYSKTSKWPQKESRSPKFHMASYDEASNQHFPSTLPITNRVN